MQQHLRIGEMASRTGRSIHTIRWYETQGLIPDVVRDGGGRRVYSEHHIRWLDLMERLRCTGMSITQMREYTALARQGAPRLSNAALCSQGIRSGCETTSPAGPRHCVASPASSSGSVRLQRKLCHNAQRWVWLRWMLASDSPIVRVWKPKPIGKATLTAPWNLRTLPNPQTAA